MMFTYRVIRLVALVAIAILPLSSMQGCNKKEAEEAAKKAPAPVRAQPATAKTAAAEPQPAAEPVAAQPAPAEAAAAEPEPAAEPPALVSFQALTVETALKAAQAALKSCRGAGFQVAVAVVDRGGHPQVILRDRFAGPHTPQTAAGKAMTAVSFRADTTELVEPTQAGQAQSGARQLPGVVMLGGGVKIEAAGSIVGGIGISGAPTGADDHACAKAGVEAIVDALTF